ncbi:MAG: glycosylase [Pseudonocardiales bacterium]|nr:glycosylase [Pseudonocardiales bacterium]
MPEGDTVWLTAHRLDQALCGREVTSFDLRVPKLALADLTGRVVTTVLARGKHILVRFDNAQTLHSHLRMDGSWQIARAGQRRRVGFDVRAIVGNSEWTCTGHRVHDLAIAATDQESIWVGHLGPDVLGPDWDPDRATKLLSDDADRPIVEALLDQRNLAGVGNMYAAELLFMAKVNPFTRVSDVRNVSELPPIAFKLLRANRDHPEQSSTGSMARGEQHWVYLRTGQPCRRCRTPIVTGEFGQAPRQRNTFWCPHCQPA